MAALEAVLQLAPLVVQALAHALDYVRPLHMEAVLRYGASFKPFHGAHQMSLSPNALRCTSKPPQQLPVQLTTILPCFVACGSFKPHCCVLCDVCDTYCLEVSAEWCLANCRMPEVSTALFHACIESKHQPLRRLR